MRNRCIECGAIGRVRHYHKQSSWLCHTHAAILLDDVKRKTPSKIINAAQRSKKDQFIHNICMYSDLSFSEKLDLVLTNNEVSHE